MNRVLDKVESSLWSFNRSIYQRRQICPSQQFTLISQNCVGGIIYNNLHIPFTSPTINTLIKGEDFVKFAEDFDGYATLTPTTLLGDRTFPDTPSFALGDIQVWCPHSKNDETARADWSRRALRIKGERYLIANTWDLESNEGFIERILRLPYKKVIFTCDPSYEGDDFLYIDAGRFAGCKDFIQRDTFNIMAHVPFSGKRVFEECFDWSSWLNGADTSECNLR